MLDHFWDVDNGGLFTTADDGEALVARQKDLMDNATPSANSIAAVAPVRLGALTGERALHRTTPSRSCASRPGDPAGADRLLEHAGCRSTWLHNGTTEIAVVGDRPDLVAP